MQIKSNYNKKIHSQESHPGLNFKHTQTVHYISIIYWTRYPPVLRTDLMSKN